MIHMKELCCMYYISRSSRATGGRGWFYTFFLGETFLTGRAPHVMTHVMTHVMSFVELAVLVSANFTSTGLVYLFQH